MQRGRVFLAFSRAFLLSRTSRVAKHTNAPRRSRRATIMSQQSNAIVAQPSSSARALKRSATPRGREMAAKKAKGIEKKLPWSRLNRREKRVDRDEDGEHQKQVPISRQRALLKAGASHAAREAARSDAFGGSVEVQRAHESAARDVASGGGNQENTADGYDAMVRSFEFGEHPPPAAARRIRRTGFGAGEVRRRARARLVDPVLHGVGEGDHHARPTLAAGSVRLVARRTVLQDPVLLHSRLRARAHNLV